MRISFIVKKLSYLLASLLIVATLTFILMKSIPGDPFQQEQAIPPEILSSLYKHYGLDEPIFVQYIKYLKGLITFDLGPSFKYEGRTVNEIILEGAPVSFALGITSLVLSTCMGITLGIASSLYRGKWQDKAFMFIAVIGMSVPSFIMASLLQYFLSIKMHLFPIACWEGFRYMVLPTLALSALPTAYIARLTRTNVIETLKQDFVLAAKAKGLGNRRIIFHHVLKNSLFPVISYLGPLAANVLTGSFIIEKMFGIPGLGRWFVTSITNRDYTMIMGMTMFYSFVFMIAVSLVDIVYYLIDPRLKKKN